MPNMLPPDPKPISIKPTGHLMQLSKSQSSLPPYKKQEETKALSTKPPVKPPESNSTKQISTAKITESSYGDYENYFYI